MADVERWLNDLGLGQYAQAFAENDIDLEVLPDLSEQDLEKLGVSMGHRKKLARAIGSLSAESEPSAAKASIVEGAEPSSPRRAEAERRQLTVMFVDLVGSTALAARLDPEDLRAVIAAYQSTCSDVIGRYEGHVAKFMGDGVLAYFGYPRAHEDDAERAVRAALELAEAIGARSPDGVKLEVRAGIATGQVVVGDLIGEGAAQEEAVVGETPNLAARLQGLAEPGNVVIAEATQRLVGALFELADLGGHHLRGFDGTIRAWRVVGDSRAESRFAARSATGLTPFVGRQHELGMLLDRFEQAREGEGQVVLLSGEPGIGKSRLAHGLIERLSDEPHTRLRFYCSPYHVNSALHPVIEQIERAAGFTVEDTAETRLDKLETLLSQGSNEPGTVAPLFAAVLSISAEARYPPLNLPARRQRELTIAAMVDQVSGLAARRPVLMILEDAHWIDPTTTELFERMIERAQTLPLLLLITFRPEFSSPWTSYPHMTSLTLNRLGRRHSTEMIAAVVGGKTLPEEVLTQIWAKTEGVPLFVEELTKTVLESGLLEDRGDRYELTGPLPPLAIPATLQDSLMARLDRLAPVKEIAQIGAVIGREFSYQLLAALSPLDETALQEALSHLVGSELVFRRGTIPDATYSFKHAFVQDAAYASLLKSKRQQLHADVAGVLRERFPELADSQPEILAHHLTEAGLIDEAIDYWQRAGHRAAERSAYAEGAAHFRRGLELLTTLPESAERNGQELDLLTALGSILIITQGHTSPDVAGVYLRARELCHAVGDTPHLAPVLQGLRLHRLSQAELGLAREAGQELLALADRVDDAGYRLEANRALGVVSFFLGEFTAARGFLERGVAIYNPEVHHAHTRRYENDPGTTCLVYLARVLWVLGHSDQALTRIEEAVALARALGHSPSLVEVLVSHADILFLRREIDLCGQQAEAALALARDQGFPLWTGMAGASWGWAAAHGSEGEAGLAALRRASDGLRGIGDRLFRPYYQTFLTNALRHLGRPREALAELKRATDSARETDARFWEAELWRLQGELSFQIAPADHEPAETCFRQAIDIARGQEAKSLELRAATSLARLWVDQGKRAEAHDLLGPVYGWFTEGFDTQDLKDAKALLDQLS